jgi:hypothetical protein
VSRRLARPLRYDSTPMLLVAMSKRYTVSVCSRYLMGTRVW